MGYKPRQTGQNNWSLFANYPSNPILSPTGGETLTAFGSPLKVGSTFYYYYMYQSSGVYVIGRATSSDGLSWTKDSANNPVFVKSSTASDWDGTDVGVPSVWKEDSTWYMLYRGSGSTGQRCGLATSTDGITWTRALVNNAAGTTGNGCIMDKGLSGGTENLEPYGVIKVGSTYYVGIDNPGGASRAAGIASGTDLTALTKHASNPLYTGGRYCTGIIYLNGMYYQFVNAYQSGLTTSSQIEVYECASPVFLPSARKFLGYAILAAGAGQWNAFGLDTICFLTDDVTRSTFALTDGDLWAFYSGSPTSAHTNFYTGIAIASKAPTPGFASLGPSGVIDGGYNVNGALTVTGDVTAGGSNGFYLTNANGFFFWTGRGQFRSPSDSAIKAESSSSGAITFGTHPFSVAGTPLPSAVTAGAGQRACVSDASAAYSSTTIGQTYSGSGSNFAPVISDGTNWIYG